MIPFKNIKKVYFITLISSLPASFALSYFQQNTPTQNQGCINGNNFLGNGFFNPNQNSQLNLNSNFGFDSSASNYAFGLEGGFIPNTSRPQGVLRKNKNIHNSGKEEIFKTSIESNSNISEISNINNKVDEKINKKEDPLQEAKGTAIKQESIPPYDSIVQEDQQLKAMVDQNNWFLNSKFEHLKTAELFAFKRGYLTTLMSIATNYNVWYSPRQEYLELETDPLVTEAMLVLEFTDSPILVYVAETLLSTMKSSKLLSPLMSDRFAFEEERLKNSRYYSKSQNDVQKDLQQAWDEYTSNITQLEQNKVPDDLKLERATKNLHSRRKIESLIRYNSKVDNSFLSTLKTDIETKISTAIVSKDTEATEELLRLYRLLLTNLRPLIAGAAPTETTDPKPIFESAKTYLGTTLTQLETAYPIKDYPKMQSVRADVKFMSSFSAVMIDPTTTPEKKGKKSRRNGIAKAAYTDLLNINILNTKSKIAMKDDQSITATQVQFVRTIPLSDAAQKKIDTTQSKAADLKNQGVTKESIQTTVQAKADSASAKVDAAKANANTKAATVQASNAISPATSPNSPQQTVTENPTKSAS